MDVKSPFTRQKNWIRTRQKKASGPHIFVRITYAHGFSWDGYVALIAFEAIDVSKSVYKTEKLGTDPSRRGPVP